MFTKLLPIACLMDSSLHLTGGHDPGDLGQLLRVTSLMTAP